ncbi:MAG TPA: aminoglycoside phosphotransferase family protein [Methylomirabilota bacterium]|nr:aminoglycoside phosphotransferase family protein [Methylomirabilota bacterium]
MQLPPSPSRDDWPSIRREFTGWPVIMGEICARHGLASGELTPAASGTNVVFTSADHVVKLYPPMWTGAAVGEHAVLEHLAGRLALETPKVVAAGSFDAWRYLVVTRLTGIWLSEVWDSLDTSARCGLAAQLGATLRDLHALPIGKLADIPMLSERWPRVTLRPVKETVAHHQRQGIEETWLAQLAVFLEHRPPLCPEPFSPVLIHGDIHPWHLLAARDGESWRLTGLVDFDDAMLGWTEYEFASPGVLMLAGDAASIETCLRAYGFGERDLNAGLRRRLMVYALLNRYWGLDVLLEYGDPNHRCATLEELERAIFPIGLE